MLNSFLACTFFSRLKLCYVTFCKVSDSYLACARNASGTKFRVKCKFFNFTSSPDMSLVPSVARLPPALSASYSDSESCSGHVFSMLSLQSNSGAGQKRPQAGPDMTVTFELQNESCAKLLNSFLACTIFSRLKLCYVTFCKISALYLA